MRTVSSRVMWVAVLGFALAHMAAGDGTQEHAWTEVEQGQDAAHRQRTTWNFDNDPADKVPSGWSIRETRPTNRLARWRVVADPTAPSEPNVFALTKTENHNGTFNLAIAPPLVWEVTYTPRPPTIDGVIDKVWAKANPLAVVVREALGGGDPREVVVRGLYTDDTLYVLAQWPDTTRSDMRDPYVWNPQTKQYDRPTRPDDQFALEFPMVGDFEINMLATGTGFVADVWHWKAGRTNPGGWSDDKRHIIGQTPVKGAKEYDLGGRATVYVARPMDEGEPSYTRRARPTSYLSDVVNSYVPQPPSGSVADVRAKGLHDGAAWTLEMSRKLDTGHSDDAVIEANEDNPCAIAILDDELNWRHSVSQLLLLRFVAR